jgi:hypothetical protein
VLSWCQPRLHEEGVCALEWLPVRRPQQTSPGRRLTTRHPTWGGESRLDDRVRVCTDLPTPRAVLWQTTRRGRGIRPSPWRNDGYSEARRKSPQFFDCGRSADDGQSHSTAAGQGSAPALAATFVATAPSGSRSRFRERRVFTGVRLSPVHESVGLTHSP